MADILKDDVRTYVKKLIIKEFGSNENKERVLSDTGKKDANESGSEHHRSLFIHLKIDKEL